MRRSVSELSPIFTPQHSATWIRWPPPQTKVAESCANSATDNAPSADDDDERKEHRSRCPLSKGDDS